MTTSQRPSSEIPDLRERGRDVHGQPIYSDRRLFVQLLAFGECPDPAAVIASLANLNAPHVLYADINDPRGIALATASESPDFFLTTLRTFLADSPFSDLWLKPEYTMMGRSYSIGYEADLDHVLIHRVIQRMTTPEWPWAVWYPLRRTGAFETLSPEEQKEILGEHGQLGMRFSAGGYGHDIRLDCRGLDKNDNDFLIGLIGKELYPLSAMVQAMRKTKQTSQYLESLGPFFIGKAIHQSPT
ncbi:MAG TPA: chlorite dismutase family protein [Kiritimatiellia bacterium]|nr:chlorite dismutase family protein [Kiritimatiellia bacterium]